MVCGTTSEVPYTSRLGFGLDYTTPIKLSSIATTITSTGSHVNTSRNPTPNYEGFDGREDWPVTYLVEFTKKRSVGSKEEMGSKGRNGVWLALLEGNKRKPDPVLFVMYIPTGWD